MIEPITITGIRLAVDKTTSKYVNKKVGRLDRYLPRHARKSASADVKLEEVNRDHGNKYEVEVILHLPDRTITAKDSTLNVLAAVDIVEAKLVGQLKRYKEAVLPHVGKRGLIGRFKRESSTQAV